MDTNNMMSEQELDDAQIKIEKPMKIADGEYKFTITDVKRRLVPFDYTDYVVKLDEFPEMPALKFGFSTYLSTTSGHFQFLKQLKEMKEGESYSVAEIKIFAVGKKLKGYIKNAPSKKDPSIKYANIVPETVTIVVAKTEPEAEAVAGTEEKTEPSATTEAKVELETTTTPTA